MFDEIEKKKLTGEIRPLIISFSADVSGKLPWKFIPLQNDVTVYPGFFLGVYPNLY